MESARRIHLSRRRVEGKPFCAINLGKDRMTTGSRRPLHFECTALERCRIKVAFTGESVNDLAPLLLDRRERYKQAARLDPEFLLELALRGFQEILLRAHFALWDGPRALVLVPPKRSARMYEQHLSLWRNPTE